jgi:hypothetical protein
MPVTISYDLVVTDGNHRTYVRSALERFHWKRLGGSVFRYDGVDDGHGGRTEDWLNHVVPALMFLRSFLLKKEGSIKFFTLDAHGMATVDLSDAEARYGFGIQDGRALAFAEPTNDQSREQALRDFVDACTVAAPL